MITLYTKALQHKSALGINRILKVNPANLLDFTSNDYLNLSKHPKVIQMAKAALDQWGAGATGARLLSGNSQDLMNLESDLACFKKQETALVFNSGFQANLTILGTLLSPQYYDKPPIVFADKLNHASMHQGCHLAGIRQHRYNHIDYDHLKRLIQKYAVPGHPHFILTESVFGMEGDIADLGIICDLAETIDAKVYVDEAHATGVFGVHGSGLTTIHAHRLFGVMGTFSKALGGFGAYFAGSAVLKEFLINFAPGFIYSTALPPATIAANHQAIKLLPSLEYERKNLLEKSKMIREKLQSIGFDIGQSSTHIIPIIIGDIERTKEIDQNLQNQGIIVSLIRPPTVPPNTTRLRLALNTTHTEEDLEITYQVFKNSIIPEKSISACSLQKSS